MTANKFISAWLALLVFGFAFQVHAEAVEVDDLLSSDCATSSNNVKLTENTLAYEAYLYKIPDTAPASWGNISGSCGTVNAYNCAAAVAPAEGLNPYQIYKAGGGGPVLATGDYMIIEDSASAICANSNTGEQCIAAGDQYQTFKIVSDIDECNETPPAESSTTATSTMTEFQKELSYYMLMILVSMVAGFTYMVVRPR